MANTKYYLEKIKREGELKDLLFKAQSVEVTYNGTEMTLAAALTEIYGSISNVPTTGAMNTAISGAIAASGHARFEKADAIPAVEAAQENVLYLVKNAETRHYDIYAKVAGETEGSYTMELLDDTTVDLTAKMDKVSGATAGNLAAMTAEGGVADSGRKMGGEALAAAPDANTLATEKAVATGLAGKVDAVEGKGLSANDYTAEDKARLAALRGVRFGAEPPADMQDGELFVRVVSTGA